MYKEITPALFDADNADLIGIATIFGMEDAVRIFAMYPNAYTEEHYTKEALDELRK